MKNIDEIKMILGEQKEEIRKRYGVLIIGIFGSCARSTQSEVSDIDILVELERPIGFKFFELWDELEKILGTKVDLLTLSGVNQKQRLWESIKEDLIHV